MCCNVRTEKSFIHSILVTEIRFEDTKAQRWVNDGFPGEIVIFMGLFME